MTNPSPEQPPILALVRDLLFGSKITSTAKLTGTSVKIIRDPAKLPGEPGRRLLVDLTLPGSIEAAATWQKETGHDAIGFVGHVETEIIAAARSAGISKVVSKGQFVQMLPDLVG
jgi:hypothetical protein